jgi:Adenylate and Guanylate cyclase catalytic domain
MESTGKSERVHLSEQTALELIQHGREDWVVHREDAVEAKGKGKMVTFWLKLVGDHSNVESVAASSDAGDENKISDRGHDAVSEWNVEMPTSQSSDLEQRNDRLAHWNSELLLELLQRVVSRRVALQGSADTMPPLCQEHLMSMAHSIGDGTIVVEEVVEVIDLPEFVCTNSTLNTELSAVVVAQLRDYVAKIASMYNNNPCKCDQSACALLHFRYALLSRKSGSC